jgi:The GLUG motif.
MRNVWRRCGFFLTRVLPAALLVQLWATAVAWGATCQYNGNDFAGGNGTANCPFEIANSVHLSNMRYFLGSHYKLIADIDMTGVAWTPIGSSNSFFNGNFDGNGFKISNLTINQPSLQYVGLFGHTNTGAVIRNVVLENVDVNGRNYVGGLVGYHRGSIINSYATGNVKSNDFQTGGLVGYNTGTITGSSADVKVTVSSHYSGGLVGYNTGTITNSYAEGKVSSTGQYVGGLVGANFGIIEKSYATGDVSGTGVVGGLVGHLYLSGSIANAYATGAVNGPINAGGLVGEFNGTGHITNTYATGTVTDGSGIGGLVGKYTKGDISGSFFDSGQPDNGAGLPKSAEEMKRYITYEGWDFEDVWYIHDGHAYPRLRWEEASWDDYSGFAVELEEEGSKDYGQDIKLIITDATGEFDQILDGEVQVTVSVDGGDDLFDGTVTFAGGNATVTVKLEGGGLR